MKLSSPSGRGLKIVSNTILVIVGLCFLLPLLWLLIASFDGTANLTLKLPAPFTLDNFTSVLTPSLAFQPLWNSVVISFGCAIITVVIAVLAAYPLSRYRMRINRPYMYGILFGTCLPITAMMVPVYNLFVSMNLLDSLWGTVLFMAATSLPMAIWMMKNFMDSVPITLEEAAWTDGSSMMSTLTRIVVPLMRPGLAVVFIFVFVQAWGNFFIPFVLLLSPNNMPASVSIYQFFGQYGAVAYGKLAAFSLIYSLPVLGLYVVTSRFLGGSSALAGAVKG
ncbi:carbohydrate ABC transporter permease [Humibacter sp.]|uniref:carbohydrate ABC transporter permease n=1 Tax=Humibacter sp. TaxID=1940291 RepID=UPI003F8012F5